MDVNKLLQALEDETNESLMNLTTDKIHMRLLQNKNVFVHCLGGISRSATVVLDYLLTHMFNHTKQENQDENVIYQALTYVQKYRQQVKPNGGFMELLTTRHIKQ